MLGDIVTRDNPHLSQVKNTEAVASKAGEIDFTSPSEAFLPASSEAKFTGPPNERVAAFITNSIAESTRRAYRSDLAHFEASGGAIPCTPATVASYLAAHVHELSVATLVRRVATLSKAHEARGLANPCRSEIVRATLRGIKRSKGTAQKQARALEREDLMLVLDQLGGSVRDVRDRALLLLCFAGGFRRSELVSLDHADVEHVRHGLIVTLRFSKNDQEGAGRQLGIPHGRTRHCPVAALDAWLARSGIAIGPIFRPVDRHGHIGVGRLSGEAVSLVVRERVGAAGIDPLGFSGHSLRAGFATSAVRAGVPTHRIRAQTGHASEAMLARYVRDGELFLGNAASALL